MNSLEAQGLKTRLLEITGETDDINQALDQWMNERHAIGELFDENQAYALAARRMNIAMEIIMRQLAVIEKEAGLLISEKGRKALDKAREQFELTQGTRAHTKQMNEEGKAREASHQNR